MLVLCTATADWDENCEESDDENYFHCQGQDNCLEGVTFVITGIFESIDRDETKNLIQRYGGKVTTNVSKSTSYLVAGRDCGQSKLDKVSCKIIVGIMAVFW